jgi:hypothetical protein
MVSPFRLVAAQDMDMVDAERKYLRRHRDERLRLILRGQRVMTRVMSNLLTTGRDPNV